MAEERNTKMVLVCRRMFPNPDQPGTRKLRTGKYVAQAAHAAVGLILKYSFKEIVASPEPEFFPEITLLFTEPVQHWIDHSYRKVCVYVDTEEELRDLQLVAESLGVNNCLITDDGLTEFGGQNTVTVLGLGPDWDDVIDQVSGHLPLL